MLGRPVLGKSKFYFVPRGRTLINFVELIGIKSKHNLVDFFGF